MSTQSPIPFRAEERIRRLERQVRRLSAICGCLLLAAAVTATGAAAFQEKAGKSLTVERLKVRRIDVVDEKGTSRVVIAAPAPGPVIDGKTYKRRVSASGVILNDSDGNERGAFVVMDDGTTALLIDYAKGKGEAVGMFASGGNARLFLKDRRQFFRIMNSVDRDGRTSLELRDAQGEVESRLPARKSR